MLIFIAARPTHQNQRNIEALTEESSAGRSINFLNWFRPTSPVQTLHHHADEQFVAIQDTSDGRLNSETGSRHHPGNGGWFHRAATIVIGSRHRQQRHNPAPALRPDATAVSWTTLQSADLHRIHQTSEPNEGVDQSLAQVSGATCGLSERPQTTTRKSESPKLQASSALYSEAPEFQRSESVGDSYSFNCDDIDETTSANINAAINSLLDFNTSEAYLDEATTSTPTVGRSNMATSLVSKNDFVTSFGIGDSVVSIDDIDNAILWDESRPESTTVVSDVWTTGRKSRWQNNEL